MPRLSRIVIESASRHNRLIGLARKGQKFPTFLLFIGKKRGPRLCPISGTCPPEAPKVKNNEFARPGKSIKRVGCGTTIERRSLCVNLLVYSYLEEAHISANVYQSRWYQYPHFRTRR